MYLTQEQIDVLAQNLRKKRLRLELLDFNMKTVDRIEGVAISGSVTANADNDIRRTGNIEMAIPKVSNGNFLSELEGYTIEVGGKIWIDKYIKIYIGIDDITNNNETVWYKLGVFLINQPKRNYSATDYIISFDCVDLMAKLTGARQGQLTGSGVTLLMGEYQTTSAGLTYVKNRIDNAVASVIRELGGFSKYRISRINAPYEYLSYDIKVDIGSTVYDILKELKNMIPTWQMYFDLDGVFVFEPIPSGKNGIVYDINTRQYITDTISSDFENVKNQIVVYGRCNNLNYYTENTTQETDNVDYDYINHKLILKFDTINDETFTVRGTTLGFFSKDLPNTDYFDKVELYDKNTSQTIKICDLVKFENSVNAFGKTYPTTHIEPNTIEPNELYFIRFYSATKFVSINEVEYIDLTGDVVCEFMGKQAVSYCVVDDNIKSPYYVNGNLPEPNFYAGTATSPNGVKWGEQYTLTLNNTETISSLQSGTIITFMANATNIYGTNNNCTYINIKDKNNNILATNVPLVQNTWVATNNTQTRPFVAQGKLTNDYTIWELKYEIINNQAQCVLVGRNNNVITKVLYGGEYDNIYADQLAYERAIYELYLYSNMNDNIELGVIPNYLIDVNCKIAYNPDKTNQTSEDNLQYYITKKITYPLGISNTTQTISAVRIYDSGNLLGDN